MKIGSIFMALLMVGIVIAGKLQGNQQEEKFQPERIQTIPRKDGSIPKLFGMTDSYGYEVSTGTM